MSKIKMVLDTATVSGVPNVNGVTYSRDEFNKMVEKYVLEEKEIVLCLHTKYVPEMKIDPENILGKVIYIMDGKIIVETNEELKKDIDNLLSKGYKPGMVYIAKTSGSESHSRTARDMKILWYEMITDYTRKEDEDEQTNKE